MTHTLPRRPKTEKTIPPRKTVEEEFYFAINPYIEDDQRLARFDSSTGKVDHSPQMILFEDGSRIEEPSK